MPNAGRGRDAVARDRRIAVAGNRHLLASARQRPRLVWRSRAMGWQAAGSTLKIAGSKPRGATAMIATGPHTVHAQLDRRRLLCRAAQAMGAVMVTVAGMRGASGLASGPPVAETTSGKIRGTAANGIN